jgi:hypothetical protein
MSQGNHIDTLEDKIDSHNFLKNLGLGTYFAFVYNLWSDGYTGDALRRKLAVARAERDRQVEAFREVSSTVEKEVRMLWQSQIDTWLKDPTLSNPYTVERKGVSYIHCPGI